MKTKPALELIAEERLAQLGNFSPEHDNAHDMSELTEAAICYAVVAADEARGGCADEWPVARLDNLADSIVVWPWEDKDWHPSEDPIRNLVKAGALIAAEIDRLQRKAARAQEKKG